MPATNRCCRAWCCCKPPARPAWGSRPSPTTRRSCRCQGNRPDMDAQAQRIRPWVYSLLLHGGIVLFLVLSFHWSSSLIPSLGGHNPEAEPVRATVVDQALIDQQMAMLKAEQQKKQQE